MMTHSNNTRFKRPNPDKPCGFDVAWVNVQYDGNEILEVNMCALAPGYPETARIASERDGIEYLTDNGWVQNGERETMFLD